MNRLLAALAIACAVSSHAFAANSDGSRPDPKLTPGAVRTTSAAIVCDKSHSTKEVRKDLKPAVKERAYVLYGLRGHSDKWCNTGRRCEVDHLISLELGGSNAIENLWPQPYEGPWNAVQKDHLENELHARVCSGRMSLTDAQTAIRTDWVAAYKRFVAKGKS